MDINVTASINDRIAILNEDSVVIATGKQFIEALRERQDRLFDIDNEVTDEDPIDIAVSTPKSIKFDSAKVTKHGLKMNSWDDEFILTSDYGEPLTPKTVLVSWFRKTPWYQKLFKRKRDR